MATHFVIPDTQVKPGVDTQHLAWIAEEIDERKPDEVIHLGDHWDMPSLSSYDERYPKLMEGRRYKADVEAGNAGMRVLNRGFRNVGKTNRKTGKPWQPRRRLLRGNHEQRIERAVNKHAQLDGMIGYHDLEADDWEVSDFLEPLWVDGVCYAHYFYNPMTGHPYGGTIDNRLQKIGHSFTMGHQQTYLTGMRYVGGRQQRGLIAGACYLHDEEYKGPQGNAHWRGVIVKHEVRDGQYDVMELSLDYLCRKYEGVSLEQYLRKH